MSVAHETNWNKCIKITGNGVVGISSPHLHPPKNDEKWLFDSVW